MKQNGALMPLGAPIQRGGSTSGVITSTNTVPPFSRHHLHHYHHQVRYQRHQIHLRATMMGPIMIVFFMLLSCSNVYGDENGDITNGYSLGPDITSTTEFDYAARGSKKFGDKCESTLECGFPGSICDSKKKSCQCVEDRPVTNHIDKCGKEASINDSCFFNEQCEAFNFQTECRDGRCICRFEMSPTINKDGTIECKGKQESREPERYVDPAMIGILAGMALMFIIICVVLRLFSRARWHENRTIFNTPNPRLMNVSLLRDSKLLHGQERRGSKISVRMPSRQPSMASLRPHSPNPSLDHIDDIQETKLHPQTNISDL